MENKRWKCDAYFKGCDGLGTCDDECQWYHLSGCATGVGSKLYVEKIKEG